MNYSRSYISPLRQRQAEETRQRIVDAALEMISEAPDGDFSHEQIAQRSEIGVRTVYRYFPTRTELLDAVWEQSSERLALANFPDTEERLMGSVVPVYRRMDEHAALMRGLMRSNAGQEMRRRDNERRRMAIEKALQSATSHLDEKEKRRVTGIFQVLYSARAWEILRHRAKLEEGESPEAVLWAMRTLLDALYQEQRGVAKDTGGTGPGNRSRRSRDAPRR